MEVDGDVGADFYFAPLPVAVAAAHVIVGWDVAEREVFPVQFFHVGLCFM